MWPVIFIACFAAFYSTSMFSVQFEKNHSQWKRKIAERKIETWSTVFFLDFNKNIYSCWHHVTIPQSWLEFLNKTRLLKWKFNGKKKHQNVQFMKLNCTKSKANQENEREDLKKSSSYYRECHYIKSKEKIQSSGKLIFICFFMKNFSDEDFWNLPIF